MSRVTTFLKCVILKAINPQSSSSLNSNAKEQGHCFSHNIWNSRRENKPSKIQPTCNALTSRGNLKICCEQASNPLAWFSYSYPFKYLYIKSPYFTTKNNAENKLVIFISMYIPDRGYIPDHWVAQAPFHLGSLHI